ncbi:TniQ family protein [Gloeothece verrucosa]|uniref:TniQ domain-containing protein n=1 Tax=Gloeothece verrucosa (strain PCC 7822) TaxID=497965 RepID=E0UM51_GLOV7|nr:TniQ family protein [Gloeothece verrucosa]ADN18031.1 conserved hypothetical protein [Gloeothece verrucosa PCC 7822]
MREKEGMGWLFTPSPYPGESFEHFLARFRRANRLSLQGLAELIKMKKNDLTVWEVPSKRKPPNYQQLMVLSGYLKVPVETLSQMLPAQGLQLYLRTRLCGKCYGEKPVHQKIWQLATTTKCEIHLLELLSTCPGCGTEFRLPAKWELGQCERCWLSFVEMGNYQKPVKIN